MNLLETVLDYMLQTPVVVKALEHFRDTRWNDVRTLDDLEKLLERFADDQEGNTALALLTLVRSLAPPARLRFGGTG